LRDNDLIDAKKKALDVNNEGYFAKAILLQAVLFAHGNLDNPSLKLSEIGEVNVGNIVSYIQNPPENELHAGA